ncbi:MAG: OmpA family protein [Acidobacteriota bacterium]|jgi:chemotaxis protein MotB|nr:OmpA family protein [Acidobacteriota bacterium]
MARKKKPEEPENHERWMVSYADFVTLLFAFFTCLYAISTVDAAKMGQMVASMRVSFGGQIFDGGSNTLTLNDLGSGGTTSSSSILADPEFPADDPNGLKGARRKTDGDAPKVILNGEADMGRFKRALEAVLSEEIKSNLVRIYLERRGIVVQLGEDGMFDSGSDVIRADGIATLDRIATSLTTIGNHIRIEGHADSVPINTARFPSNMHLSVSRASNVLQRMETVYGMSPQLLSAAGYGEYRPVASNDTSEGRARNRRVDVIIMDPRIALGEPL